MKLGALAARAGVRLDGHAEDNVTGFAIDHRKVAPGNVFGAFQGLAANGEDFIPAAEAAGAIAIVARPEAAVAAAAHIADPVPRRAFARLAAQFFSPVPETVVAVTGTNGKTSTVEMTRQLWRMLGERAASIGTLGVTTPDESVSTGLTTPDIVTFLSNMVGLAREGVTHVAYEASSHGLAQYRNEGVRVVAAAFTNLSRDHLDYHKDMEDYFAAKMRLFDEIVTDGGAAVIWSDDVWSPRASEHARRRGLRLFTVGEAGDGNVDGIRLLARSPTQLGQELELEQGTPLRGQEPIRQGRDRNRYRYREGTPLRGTGTWEETGENPGENTGKRQNTGENPGENTEHKAQRDPPPSGWGRDREQQAEKGPNTGPNIGAQHREQGKK